MKLPKKMHELFVSRQKLRVRIIALQDKQHTLNRAIAQLSGEKALFVKEIEALNTQPWTSSI